MAFLLSPGVQTTETDLTNVVPAVATSIGATVGVFKWGPLLTVKTVDFQGNLIANFGKPDADTATSFYTAANFLDYTNQLKVVRVAGGNAKNATADGKGLLIKNFTDYETSFIDGNGSSGTFAAKYAGDLGNSLQIVMADKATFDAWEYRANFTNPPNVNESDNDEIHVLVIDKMGKFSGTKGAILEKYPFVSKAYDSKSTDGTNNYYKNVLGRSSAYIYWMDHPVGMYDPSVKFDGGTNTVFLTDTQTDSYRLEASGNVLRLANHGFANGETIVFDQINRTTSIAAGTTYYVVSATKNTFAISETLGGISVDIDINGYAIVTRIKPHPFANDQKIKFESVAGAVTGVTEGTVYFVVNSTETTFQVALTLGGTPVVMGGDGVGTLVSVAGADWGSQKDGTVFKDLTAPIDITLGGGVDDNNISDESAVLEGWQLFQDPEVVDVNLLIGGACTTMISKYIIQNVAESRKDCVAFVSPPMDVCVNNPYVSDDLLDWRTDASFNVNSSYGALDSGWKYHYDQYNQRYMWAPLCADMAGLHARTDSTNDAWWAAAGLNRGQIKNVVKLSWNPGQADRDRLYQAGINPVVSMAGQGIVLFGNKTLLSKPSAFDRINVRRLFIVLEKSISKAAKYFLFEFNDPFTRAQFVNMVTPFLQMVKGRRGINSFRVVCDETNNPQQIVSTNQFIADIKILPNYSAEYITLNFVAVNNEAMFTEQ